MVLLHYRVTPGLGVVTARQAQPAPREVEVTPVAASTAQSGCADAEASHSTTLDTLDTLAA
jgi:hypothetical protein